MHESVPDIAFPLPLTAYTSVAGVGLLSDLCTDRGRSVQRGRHRHLPARRHSHVLRGAIHRGLASRSAPARSAERGGGPRTAPERRGRAAALPRRGRGRVRALGRAARARHRDVARLDDRRALSERHGQLHRTDVRRGDHGAGVDAADRRAGGRRAASSCRISAAGRRARGGSSILTIGPLLGSFITEPGAMTIAALLLARQFYDLKPSPRVEVRHARSALRERVDRRDAHALRRAADPDGRATLGMGYRHSSSATSDGAPRWRSPISTLGYYLVFRREFTALASRQPVPDVIPPAPDAVAFGQRLLPIPWGVTAVYVLFMVWTVVDCALSRAVPDGIPVLPWLRSRVGSVLDVVRLQDAAARRILSRRPRRPRRAAGLVDRAGDLQPRPRHRCSSAPRFSRRSTTTP